MGDWDWRSDRRGNSRWQQLFWLRAEFFLPSGASVTGHVCCRVRTAPFAQFVELSRLVLHHLFRNAFAISRLVRPSETNSTVLHFSWAFRPRGLILFAPSRTWQTPTSHAAVAAVDPGPPEKGFEDAVLRCGGPMFSSQLSALPSLAVAIGNTMKQLLCQRFASNHKVESPVNAAAWYKVPCTASQHSPEGRRSHNGPRTASV
jgi:hypothetical protein